MPTDKKGRAASPSHAAASGAASTTTRALTPNRQLSELLRAIEPRCALHPAVEELLLDMASEFVDDVVGFAGRLAKHRRAAVLEPRDLQLCLAKNYGISLAGVLPSAGAGADALHPLGQELGARSRPARNSLHMHRVALKRKALLRARAKLKAAMRPASAAGPGAAGRKLARKNSSAALETK